jgi:hypothetical protein
MPSLGMLRCEIPVDNLAIRGFQPVTSLSLMDVITSSGIRLTPSMHLLLFNYLPILSIMLIKVKISKLKKDIYHIYQDIKNGHPLYQ